ncbi:hypothetical protein ACOQFO_06220 [Ureibacillus sp. MALMAid1270]|uniref:hypothetical protein n=1 Tax=Ureibacillus sp. MALMAid1270 TaxID=3411629 RepID=UPI003BA83D51
MSLVPDKTQTVTFRELQDVLNANRKMQDYIRNNNTDVHAMQLSFASFASAILGLAFWQYTAGSIAYGIVSIVTGVGAMTRDDALQAVKDGETEILRVSNTMSFLGADTANITVGYTVLDLEKKVSAPSSAKTNYMTKNGIIITG